MAAGFDPVDFWHRTPREIAVCLEGAMLRARRQADFDKVLAWNIAALSRVPRLPELASLLSSVPEPPPQTPDQQWAIMTAMAERRSRQPH